MSLFLKYRPQNFEDVVAQSHIKDILKAQINSGGVNSNYLFFGPRGTGKTTLARLLARSVNCTSNDDQLPCNECESCKAILSGNTLDFIEIDAASHTQVDNIREEIIEKAPYPPTMLKKKVYIIDEVHMLSKAAFNALLKIMEEPPEYLMFILATTEINKVPDTIASRCQVFNFKKLGIEDIVGRLKYIADSEGFRYDEKSFELIANVSDGAMRDAIKYLDQVSILGEISQENVSKFLGVAPDKIISDFIKSYKSGDINKVFEILDDLVKGGVDLYNFAREILVYIDNNFTSDIDFFIALGDVFKSIILGIKNYPFPLVIYKSEIYKALNPDANIQIKAVSLKPVSKLKQENNIEKKLVEEKNEDLQDPKQDSSNNTIDEDSFLDSLILNIKKAPIKGALKSAKVDCISDGLIKLIIVSNIHYSILSKAENIEYIEQVIESILNYKYKLEVEFMSKEDYINKSLF